MIPNLLEFGVYQPLLPTSRATNTSMFAQSFPLSEGEVSLDAPAFLDANLPKTPTITRRQLRSLSSSLAWCLRTELLVPDVSNPCTSSPFSPAENVMILSEVSLSWPI